MSVLFALALCSIALGTASAQSLDQPFAGYVMKRWTSAEGLPHNSIQTLLQTRDGYLWIGMTRDGLVRFDGDRFTSFDVFDEPGRGSTWIGSLHEDADGTLWIGTDAGLVRYREGVFRMEPLDDKGTRDGIVSIRSDREGRLWVATFDRIVRREGGTWTTILTTTAIVRSLLVSVDGTAWVATETGLIEWRDGVARARDTNDELPDGRVWALHEDRNGRVWIATERGLAYVDRGADAIVTPRDRSSTLPVYALFEDSRGVLWIGGIGRVLARAPDGTLTESPFAGEGESATVQVIAEDREARIWFGVAGGAGGLHRLAPELVTVLTHEQGLPCDNIATVAEGEDGTLWFSTFCADGRGVMAMRDGKITAYPGPAYVESMLVEPDGVVWAGTFAGRLYRLDRRRSSVHGFVEIPAPVPGAGVPEAGISAIHRHGDGALWLGTGRGLLRWHEGRWSRYRASDGLVNDDVRTIVGDGEGGLWIGTSAGISRYRHGQFTSYRLADGVPPGPVRAIHVDAEGVVWIGTYGGGLARLKDGVFAAYGERDGILDSSVHRILEDEDGHLWLAGDHGIRRASKRDLHAMADGQPVSPEVMLFDEADGMRSQECNGMSQPAGWRTRDGVLYFPTQRGIARIDSARARAAAALAPLPHIEAVRIDGAAVAAGAEVIAAPGYREIEIRYTAPNFHRANDLQFRYRLEGYDRDWIDVDTRRVASYANLKPGRYRFLVTARESEGPWQARAAVLSVVLQPHLYQRRGFQIALLALALASIVVGGRLYVAHIRERAKELERAVAERTADVSAAHDRLSAAHENLTVANNDLTKAKLEVEQAHGQVLAVLNQLDIGVLVLGGDGVVRYASVAAQRVLRKDEQALIGRLWSTCLPLLGGDQARVKARIEALSSSSQRAAVQMVIGGTRYWMEIDVRAEPPPGAGRILYMYNVTETAALPHVHADGSHGIVGKSTAIHLVRKQIRDVARVDSTVLIEGETGVGKELVARAIHRTSARAGKPFVAVNAAGLSESLLASQLFGHRRGAFTGAVDDQMGVFEAAHGGTLFLDEIGDMPASMQASLLRVLQEREITRLGESHARRVDVRFIAATHRNLIREVETGRFRDDLLYRIRVATVVVPPLRNRLDDVPPIVEAFVSQAAEEASRPAPDVSRDAMDALLRHKWPGNVRELRAAIERALVNAPRDVIRLEDLPPEIAGRRAALEISDQAPAAQTERDRLLDALRRANGNRAQAARLLGIGRTTLYKRLAEYGLGADESR